MSDTLKLTDAVEGDSCPLPFCASWIPGDKPDTKKGSTTLLWVTMCHKASDKLSVGVMTYHNGHVMPCSDQCDPPDCAVPHNPEEDGYCEEYEWTCWSDGYCEHCETEWVWSSHHTEIVAHAPVVKPAPFLPNIEKRASQAIWRASGGCAPRPSKFDGMREYWSALQGKYPNDRLDYWWAWHKHDTIRHSITIAIVCIAVIIGGCVLNPLPTAALF